MAQTTEIVSSNKVIDFLTVANEFTLLIENCSTYPRDHVIDYLQRVMPLLYLKGSLLPFITPSDPEQNERFVTEEQYEKIFNELRVLFGDSDIYWRIANPTGTVPEPVRGSIAEDLADIYQEMKDFILLYQKSLTAAKENAVFSCYKYFRKHWGRKALTANEIIHDILNPVSEKEN